MTTIQARESLPIGSGDPALPVSDDDRLQRVGSAQGTGTSSLVLGSAQGTGTSSLDRGSHSLPPLPMETDIERSQPSMIGDNAGALELLESADKFNIRLVNMLFTVPLHTPSL